MLKEHGPPTLVPGPPLQACATVLNIWPAIVGGIDNYCNELAVARAEVINKCPLLDWSTYLADSRCHDMIQMQLQSIIAHNSIISTAELHKSGPCLSCQ